MHTLRTTLAFLVLAPLSARAQIAERLDVSSAGVFGNVPADRVVSSDDGQVAAFLSRASNLVLPDDATSIDVYVRDRATSTTIRISGNVDQTERLEISGNGRFVVFARHNAGGPQPSTTTFVHDRTLVTTTQVGAQFHDALPGAITADGRFMVLYARPSGLPVPQFNAYRADLQLGTVLLASHVQGLPERATLERGGLSADGESLVFSSLSPSLVAGDTNGATDVFLFRASTSLVERISVDDLGVGANQDSIRPSISGDGALVAFMSQATNLDPADNNGHFDVYMRDLNLGTTRRASFTSAGEPLNGPSEDPLISASGRYVAFETIASNAIPGDGASTVDVLVRDLESGLTRAVTPGSANINEQSSVGSISGDGHWVAVRSTILSLPDAGATGGAYLADFGPGCSASGYCTSLPNSTGMAASIGAQGDASLLLNNFTLSALNLPPNAIAIFASGTASVDPGVPFGNGLRCIGGTQRRHGVLHASRGVVIDYQDLTLPEYAGIQPGEVRFYQCIYRDPAAGGAAFNTTDAVAVTFCF